MERVQLLSDLNKRIAGSAKPQAANAPFIFTVMRKCIEYQIPSNLVDMLNYEDLLYMIVEYDIEKVKDLLQQKEKQRLEKQGVDVEVLSPEQVAKFMRGGK